MHSGIPDSQAWSAWRRGALRAGGTALAAAVLVGLAPAVAGATPGAPSDGEISTAQAQADAVAARIGALDAQLATSQAAVDSAREQALLALDGYQATEEAAEAARRHAEQAEDESRRTTAELGVARDDLVAFARRTYMEGSTSPGASSLLTAGSPGQLIERAALLEAAGSHRSDVLVQVTVLQERATKADIVARTALVQADELREQAAEELEVARTAEISARAQQAQVRTEQAAVQAELDEAERQLTTLVGAREAAELAAAERAAAAPPAPVVTAPVVTAPEAPAAGSPEVPDVPTPDAPVAPPAPPAGAPAPPAAPPVAAPIVRPAPAPIVRPAPPAGPGSSAAAQTAIAAGMRYIGTPYAWGGGGSWGPGRGQDPDRGVIGFDCSGLTQYAYARAGISIPRNSRAQYAQLPKVARGALKAGDLVFWATDPSRPSTIHHVAIYLGGDRILEAPESGSHVRTTAMRWGKYAGAVRPSA